MTRANQVIGTCVVIGVVCVVGAAIPADDRATEPHDDLLLERFLAIDADVLGIDASDEARRSAAEHAARVEPCLSESEPSRRETCVVQSLVGPGGMSGLERTSSPHQSSVAYALVEGKGSCSALVATLLALSENLDVRLQAVVLREHVVLSSTSKPGTYYEVLDGGRRFDRSALAHREFPPGGLEEVTPRSFEAYYLDNLAARLAETGDASAAEDAFRRALAIDGGPARIRYNYGTFLLQQGRFAEAEKMLSRAIGLGWKDAAAYVNRGAARWKLERVRAARRDFEKALKLDPANREAATNLRRLAE